MRRAGGPVRVRVPAKINLHLGVGRAASGRVPRAEHRLPRDQPLRRAARQPRRHARADHGGRGRRRAGPGRDQPGDPGRPGAGRARPRARVRPAAPAQVHPARRRPGRRQRRRGRHPAGLRRALGHRRAAATSSPRSAPPSARTSRSCCTAAPRWAPAAARRSARSWPGRPPGTGWSRSPTAACPPRRSTASWTGCANARGAPPPLDGRGRADDRAAPARPDGARRRARQRPAAGRARRCGPSWPTCSRPGTTPARSPASSPAPGRPACSSPPTPRTPRRVAAGLNAAGVCREARTARGPMPGARVT